MAFGGHWDRQYIVVRCFWLGLAILLSVNKKLNGYIQYALHKIHLLLMKMMNQVRKNSEDACGVQKRPGFYRGRLAEGHSAIPPGEEGQHHTH